MQLDPRAICAGQRSRSRVPVRGARGFTLLELLAVMALLAVLFGMGSGVFASLDVGARGTTGLLKTLVRSTREQAVRTALPARCDLDAVAGTAVGVYLEDIGQWHFESQPAGGWNAEAEESPPPNAGYLWGYDSGSGVRPFATGARSVAAGGAPGGYLALGGEGRLSVPTGEHLAFLCEHGFAIGLTIRLHQPDQGRLAMRSRSYELSLARDGSLRARIYLAEQAQGRTRSSDTLLLRSAPGEIVPGVWTRVELVFEGRVALLLVDGREAAREETSMTMMLGLRESADVVIGQGLSSPFDLDDLTLSAVRLQGPVELPENLHIAAMESDGRPTSHLSIYFTPDGFLEPRAHREAVHIVLEEEGERSKREAFRVGLLGVLQDESPPEYP